MNRDALIILLFLGLWIVLNKWVLPWFGIPTCMSGGCCGPSSCAIQPRTKENPPETSEATDETESQSRVQNGGKTAP
ncbi:MAG: hypothetical protein KatS3mg112_0469 [Thermogutta sp.]|nr:MAG: hypothetical protein KatS3mg112_0469 [Thermogutta sp.]